MPERELEDAVAGLYAAFAGDQVGQLNADDLRTYAITGAVDTASFKRVLPRLLELAAVTPAWADLETPALLRRIADASWTDWAVDEVAAITRYLNAVWRAVLLRDDGAWRAGLWLAAIGGAVESLEPFLETWCQLAANKPAALRQLAHFVQVEGVSAVRRRRLVDVWWTQRSAQAAHVLAWLGTDAPRSVLQAGFLAHEAEPWATDVSEAEWVLGWLQQEASRLSL